MRTTLVFLKMSDVLSLNTLSSLGRFAGSVIGPNWWHAMEKRDGSSATPAAPFHPPVFAWLMWQVTPFTRGSSNACTHTLSFGEKKWNVVDVQPTSSAAAGNGIAAQAIASPMAAPTSLVRLDDRFISTLRNRLAMLVRTMIRGCPRRAIV